MQGVVSAASRGCVCSAAGACGDGPVIFRCTSGGEVDDDPCSFLCALVIIKIPQDCMGSCT